MKRPKINSQRKKAMQSIQLTLLERTYVNIRRIKKKMKIIAALVLIMLRRRMRRKQEQIFNMTQKERLVVINQ